MYTFIHLHTLHEMACFGNIIYRKAGGTFYPYKMQKSWIIGNKQNKYVETALAVIRNIDFARLSHNRLLRYLAI